MTYRFYIGLTSGEELSWSGLSLAQAQKMNAVTKQHVGWTNVSGFGYRKEGM